jgi:CRISPR subtype II RNA-guided endonuclease Cas9/Csn1
MKKILGLDIGTNSIGWALINEKDGVLQNIVGMGCRIIPEKDEHRDFEKGREISKNATRRQKRGSRRLNERYKMRRNNLIKLFNVLEIVPSGLERLFEKIRYDSNKIIMPQGAFQKKDKQFKPHELYELRNRALKEKVSLEELFRIIYHLNQRRGFKSNRKAYNEEEKLDIDILDEKEKKADITYEKVKIASAEPTGERKGKQKKEELKVILEDGRYALTDKYIFKKFIGESIILEIKKENIKSTNEIKYSFSFPSKWQRSRKELNDSIVRSGGFPGKYFYEEYIKYKNEGNLYDFKVRENIVNRDLYINEFDSIWNAQYNFWKNEGVDIDFLPKFRIAIDSIVPSHNKDEKQKWYQKGLGAFIKNYIVYYQRDLKSQTKTIGDCQFEEKFYSVVDKETGEEIITRNGPKCCPKSHPAFQEFRIWQQINNLICYNNKEEVIPLDYSNKVILFDYLNERDTADKKQIEKELKKHLEDFSSTNIAEGKSWVGNKTMYFFRKIFKKYNYDGSHLLSDIQLYLRMWHLLYSVGNEKGIKNGLKKLDSNMSDEVIELLCKVDYKEKDYASLSLKAINNLLPLMRCGKYYSESNLTEKIISKITMFLNNELDDEFDPKTLERLKTRKGLTEFQGLSYFEAASLIYGSHSAKQLDKYNSFEEIQIIKRHSLRNPVVEQIVNETLMLVKEIWKNHPDIEDGEIKIELARELKSNKEEREKISNFQVENSKINQLAVEEIRRHKGQNYNPSLAEIEKIKLWNEMNKKSPYTGKVLGISDVLSANTEIDHIIPRSRYYNDGLINKVVCESHINADKGNMTAFEYMTTGTPRQNEKLSYDDFIVTISSLPRGKRRMLTMKEIPDGFIDRQIKDTQYISKRVKEELGKIVGIYNVKSTTGQITDYLKEQWGVAELMRRLIKPRFEILQEKYKINDLVREEDVLDKDGNPTGKKKTVIKGYSKRFDHRHHALDALIVSCTRQGIIQQLNLLNQITKGKIKSIEETIGGNLRKFIPPTGKTDKNAEKFYSIVEEAIENIIVSYNSRKRLVSKGVNWFQKFNPEKNRIEKVKQDENNNKGRAWAIKGQLHKETNYGIYEYNGELRHISKCELINLTPNKISNIPDDKLRNEISNHINNSDYNGDIKKAFGPEGIIEFNKNRTIPVYSVRVMEDGKVGEVKGKIPLYTPERKLEVEKGGNFCVVFYEHPETKERKFDTVSFIEAVQLKTSGENPYVTDKGLEYQKQGYKFIFTLTHNNLVYVPTPDEIISHIDWDSKNKIFDRIYRVVKFTDCTIYFVPHNYSKEILVHEGKAKNASQHKGEFGFNTGGTQYFKDSKNLIRNICIKLNVDRLGNIKPYFND